MIQPNEAAGAEPTRQVLTATSAGELWGLYLEALRRALRIPPEVAFMASPDAVPLALEIASQAYPVPLPQALAQVYRYGNTMPRWSTVYQPSADGQVFSQYEAFVWAIAVPPDGGDPYAQVLEARELLAKVDEQIAAGTGSLVMTIATDSGSSTVPRFDSGPLGNPGYSSWLDNSILGLVHGLPPQVDITVYPDPAAAGKGFGAGAGRGDESGHPPPFLRAPGELAGIEEEIVSLQLVIYSVTSVWLQPGAWFVASLLRDFTRPEQFIPGTAFATQAIWGPNGIFNLIPTGLWAGFRPKVVVTLTPEGLARIAEVRARGGSALLGVGPFTFDLAAGAAEEGADDESADEELRLDPADFSITWSPMSIQGLLLGIVADHPNSADVPREPGL